MTSADVETVKEIERASDLSPWSNEDYVAEISREGSLAAVSEGEDGQIAGFVIARRTEVDRGESAIEILNIAVAPAVRRSGVGGALMKAVEAFGTAEGAGHILLEVRDSNRGARSFYERHGFMVIGIRKNFYSNPPGDALTCRKILSVT